MTSARTAPRAAAPQLKPTRTAPRAAAPQLKPTRTAPRAAALQMESAKTAPRAAALQLVAQWQKRGKNSARQARALVRARRKRGGGQFSPCDIGLNERIRKGDQRCSVVTARGRVSSGTAVGAPVLERPAAKQQTAEGKRGAGPPRKASWACGQGGSPFEERRQWVNRTRRSECSAEGPSRLQTSYLRAGLNLRSACRGARV